MPADNGPDGKGYNKWETAVEAMPRNVTHVIFHRADATGDIPHVLAVLANDPKVGVVVFDAKTRGRNQDTSNAGPSRVADAMADYGTRDRFRERIKYANFDGKWAPTHDPIQLKKGGGRSFHRMNLFGATQRFQSDLASIDNRRANYDRVKELLRGAKLSTEAAISLRDRPLGELNLSQVDDYCMNYWLARIQPDIHTVVLWGRKSGKKGGMHRTQDHSYTVWAEIAEQCARSGYQVIIAGDYEFKDTDARNRIAEVATIIGEFFRGDTTLSTRANQIRLFYILKRLLKSYGKRLVHVGMRSGGLDFHGFAGQRVIYMTGTDARGAPIDDDRMAGVVDTFNQFRTDEGQNKANKYQKFQAPRNPKRGEPGGAKWRDDKGLGEIDQLIEKIRAAMA